MQEYHKLSIKVTGKEDSGREERTECKRGIEYPDAGIK